MTLTLSVSYIVLELIINSQQTLTNFARKLKMKELIKFAEIAKKESEKYDFFNDVEMSLDDWIDSAIIHKDEGHSIEANDKQAVQAFIEDVIENGQF